MHRIMWDKHRKNKTHWVMGIQAVENIIGYKHSKWINIYINYF